MLEKNYAKEVEEATKDVDFSKESYQIELETNKGKILIDLYPDIAPKHCKNMIGLAKVGFYDNLLFHRVIAGFVIQGGCPRGTGTGGPGYQVDAEFNERKHEPGVLSMARAQDPNSAGSQFFLCLNDVPHLDNQYTVFGKTADQESLDVVLEIGRAETGAQDKPREELLIQKASVVTKAT
ncbi:MAG: peptidylprolyl isomerase [Oligoflexales bacterium]